MDTQFTLIIFIVAAIFTPLALVSAVVKLLMIFRSEVVQGKIVFKDTNISRNGKSYSVNYHFHTIPPEAKLITKSIAVTKAQYESVQINMEVTVRYLVDYPGIAKLVGIESDAYVYLLMGIAVLSLFLCISTVLFTLRP